MKNNVLISLVFIMLTFFATSVNAQNWMQTGTNLYGINIYSLRGNSVATNSDGSRMIVGSPGTNESSFRIYQWDTGTNDWTYEFGFSTVYELGWDVAMSDDGLRVVALQRKNNGNAYVYSFSGGSWSSTGTIFFSTNYGNPKVAISGNGNYIAIRDENYAKVYDYNGSYWVQRGSSFAVADFDYDIDLDYDGSHLTIGHGYTASYTYTVRVYLWNGSDYGQMGSDITESSEGFGYSISMSNSGERIAIGDPEFSNYVGAAYVYEFSSGSWSRIKYWPGSWSNYKEQMGGAVAISNDGTKCSVAAKGHNSTTPTDGRIITYENTSGTIWGQVGQQIYFHGSYVLSSIAISGDGDNIIAGCPYYNTYQGFVASYGPVVVPTTQATNTTFSNVQHNQMQLDWTKGDGTSRVVFMKAGSSGSLVVTDNNSYTASTSYGSGSSINYGGSYWYCVYNGTGSSVNVTNLSPNTAYQCQVFEYNGNLANYKLYLTSTATGNPETQTTTSTTPTLSTTAISSITATTASSGGNISSAGGQSVTARGIVWNTTGSPTVDGYDGITTDGSGTGSFTSSLTNLLGNTTFYVRAYATNSEGTGYGSQRNFTTSDYTDITWDGSEGTDWDVPGNWNLNVIPSVNHDVTITDQLYSPVISETTEANCNNLIIQSGATLTLLSTTTGTGSLIIKGDITNNGAITAQRHITGSSNDWHLLSSPVTQQEISGNFTDANGYDFYLYNEPSNEWINRKNLNGGGGNSPYFDVINGDINFTPATGYLVAYTNPNTNAKSFTGTFNQGTISQSLSISGSTDYQGANLVGNPYPSSIDWKAASGWARSLLREDGGGYTLYIWNETADNYGTFNSNGSDGSGTDGATRYIAPMQGFFVMAASSGSFQMTEDICVHNATTWLKETVAEVEVIRIKVSHSEYGYDECVIEQGLQNEGGAPKMFSFVETAPSLYLPKEGKDYAISFVSSIENNQVIPVNFEAGATGYYTLDVDFTPEYYNGLHLEDTKTGLKYNLLQDPSCSFIATENDDANRFLLHFGPVGIEEPTAANQGIQTWASNNTIHIFNEHNLGGDVKVVNMYGQTIINTKLTGDANQQIRVNSPSGYYIVNIVTQNGVVNKKVYLK